MKVLQLQLYIFGAKIQIPILTSSIWLQTLCDIFGNFQTLCSVQHILLLIVIKSETLCRFSNTVCVRKRMNAQLPTTNNLKTFWSRGRVGKYVKLLFDRKMHSYEYIHLIRRCRKSFVILEVYYDKSNILIFSVLIWETIPNIGWPVI